jgi:hypothetical protein
MTYNTASERASNWGIQNDSVGQTRAGDMMWSTHYLVVTDSTREHAVVVPPKCHPQLLCLCVYV